MGAPTLPLLHDRAKSCNDGECALDERRAEFVEAPASRSHAARGVLTGVLLGAGLWSAILVLAGVIKL